MSCQHCLQRWLLSDLEPGLRAATAELYQEQSSRLSLKCFAFYFFAKLAWMFVYLNTSSGMHHSRNSLLGFDSAKWRALIGQFIQVLVMACMLGVAFRRHRKGLPIRLPRVVLGLPTVLATVSATLHMESIRFAIDGVDLRPGWDDSGKVYGLECVDIVDEYRHCLELSGAVFLHSSPNTSESYRLAFHTAEDSCSRVPIFALAPEIGAITERIRNACLWKCFDTTTFSTLSLEFIVHFLVLLPADLGALLMLPTWLILAVPTRALCGADKWFFGLSHVLKGESVTFSSAGNSGNPLMLLGISFFSVLVSCLRSHLQLEVAKHMMLARREVVHEKVKRREAEFKLELSKSQAERAATERDDHCVMVSVEHHSQLTALSVLLSTRLLHDECNMCDSGNWLPESYLVQAEHAAGLVPLSQLRTGTKILCYDHILQTPRYSSVTELVDGESSSAVADDTIMVVTSYHPMKTKPRSQNILPVGATPVYNLRPGEHTIACIHPAQVGVKSIEPCPAPRDAEHDWFETELQCSTSCIDDMSRLVGREVLEDDIIVTQQGPMTARELKNFAEEAFPLVVQVPGEVARSRRVKLSVWQGDRYSVLVKTPASNESPMGWATVASANASVDAGKLHTKWDTLNVNYGGRQPLRRCHSEPAIDRKHGPKPSPL